MSGSTSQDCGLPEGKVGLWPIFTADVLLGFWHKQTEFCAMSEHMSDHITISSDCYCHQQRRQQRHKQQHHQHHHCGL